jgi:hypothetical protein
MARLDPRRNGTTETEERARGAENSKDTLGMLVGGFVLSLIAIGILVWYFGIWPFHHAPSGVAG